MIMQPEIINSKSVGVAIDTVKEKKDLPSLQKI